MKGSEKQLPRAADFSTFLQHNCSNFRLKLCDRPLPKLSNKIKFEGVWAELEAKIVFRDNHSQDI